VGPTARVLALWMTAAFWLQAQNARRMSCMGFELLHIDDCPNWDEAGRRLQTALHSTGHGDEPIGFRLIRSSEDTSGTVFAGSPTITLNGVDLIPSQGATSDLACRIYVTPLGLADLPTVAQLIEGFQDS
jgi:hypothetical protein